MQFKFVHFQLFFIFFAFFASILIFYHLIRNRQKRISTRLTSPALFSPKEVRYLQCSAFFDQNYNFANYRHERYIYKDPTTEADLPIGCGSIKSRSYFQDFLYPEEMEHPIAYARAIYRDYRFIEMELAGSYAPQNVYCYALDAKSSPLFHKRMQSLASCFPNVYLTEREFNMDSGGHNITHSHFECMKLLAKQKWKYLILLQNHDVAIKTNQELIEIFKWLNGTNFVEAGADPGGQFKTKMDWSFKALNLFKDDLRNTYPYKGFKPEMRFAKSLNEVALSREMVDFVLNKLNITIFMDQVNSGGYAIDEIFMGSLNANDAIDVPGGFTMHCLDQGKAAETFMRLSQWTSGPCLSMMWRHYSCVFGVEHLHLMSQSDYLFVNKMLPYRDMGAFACWHEMLFNRTHFDRGLHRLKPDIYLGLPQIRYNRDRKLLDKNFNVTNFMCSLDNGSAGQFRSHFYLVFLFIWLCKYACT